MGLQKRARQLVDEHVQQLRQNYIHNGALLLIENNTGMIKAYVGNVSSGKNHFNDMLIAPRSSGSILKPFLYAAMLTSGDLLPKQLVPDVPTFLGGFKPQNFINAYDGVVSADRALARSLNIPAVLQLKEYGIERFLRKLHQLGFSTMEQPAHHYGLSLVLGGAEVNAWDLGRAYYHLAATLNKYPVATNADVIEDIRVEGKSITLQSMPLNAGAVFETFNVLTTLNRPDSEMGWQKFNNSNIAWKTGTSFGFRDAWAVGVTPKYTCVVWVGNADGEGRPGLIGAQAAGPVLFSYLNSLPHSHWFATPWDELTEKEVCKHSGLLAGRDCPKTEKMLVPLTATATQVCRYHKTIYTNKARTQRLSVECMDDEDISVEAWFVLPPAQAWYYAKRHPDYQPLPPWKKGCANDDAQVIEVIYPKHMGQVFIPKELHGESSKVIVEVAHQQPSEKLYWHINGQYMGETETFHQLALSLEKGQYELLVEDRNGNIAQRKFEVVQRE
jgi:penicillin-binding protein 1C